MLSGFLDGNGVLGTAATDFPRGLYEVVLHVGTFCASEGLGRSEPPFLDEVPVRFAVSQPNERYQLSIYITPWSYSVFRAS